MAVFPIFPSRRKARQVALDNLVAGGGGGGGGGSSGGGVLVVGLTMDGETNTITMDKTAGEIWTAFQNGFVVVKAKFSEGESYTLMPVLEATDNGEDIQTNRFHFTLVVIASNPEDTNTGITFNADTADDYPAASMGGDGGDGGDGDGPPAD